MGAQAQEGPAMTPSSLDVALCAAAAVCLWLGLLLNRTRLLWQSVGRGLVMAAIGFAGAAAVLVAVSGQGTSLSHTALPLLLTSTSALAWYLSWRDQPSSLWQSVLLATIASALLAWALAVQGSSVSHALPADRIWRIASGLLFALACGGFIESACRAAPGSEPCDGEWADGSRVAIALAFLTGSLLSTVMHNAYSSGAWWSWTSNEAWMLILLLWQVIAWWGQSYLLRRRHGIAATHTIGLALAFLSLRALVG